MRHALPVPTVRSSMWSAIPSPAAVKKPDRNQEAPIQSAGIRLPEGRKGMERRIIWIPGMARPSAPFFASIRRCTGSGRWQFRRTVMAIGTRDYPDLKVRIGIHLGPHQYRQGYE